MVLARLLILVAFVLSGASPGWISKESGYHQEHKKSFYGVGSVRGLTNEHLAWATAESRAKAELARSFETYTAYLMRDYLGSGPPPTAENPYIGIGKTVKTFSAGGRDVARLAERYQDPDTGTYYVLMELDLQDATSAMIQAKEVNSRIREFVRENAERVFDRLADEQDNRASR